ANEPMPSAGSSSVPSVRVIFCEALWVSKQYQGSPRLQARQSPQMARQLRMTKSPTSTLVTPSPTSETTPADSRSEEHTSELQSRFDLVCRLLLEKKNAQRS